MGMPTDLRPKRAVTDQERATFARDGVAHLPSIYPSDWVDYLEHQLTDVFDNQPSRVGNRPDPAGASAQGQRVDMVALAEYARSARPDADFALEGGGQAGLVGRSIVETDASAWHDGMRGHNTAGPLPEIVAGLTGTAKINFYSDQLFLKEPGSRVRTPFHQDKPYFLVDGGDVAVAWVPVDVVTVDNGAMRYVRGSHLWGETYKPSDFLTNGGTFPETKGIDLSELAQLPPITDDHDVVTFDAKPGDVIVHHWATIHGSAGNVSTTAKRRAASVRYACDGCTYFQRKSSPEPFRFDLGLSDGEPLEAADRFPVVWPRTPENR